MSLPPVVGTVFRLEKVCATHGTAVGMHAVIVAYTRNDSKDRMEVEVDVFGPARPSLFVVVGLDWWCGVMVVLRCVCRNLIQRDRCANSLATRSSLGGCLW